MSDTAPVPPSRAQVGDRVRVLRSWSRRINPPDGYIDGTVTAIRLGARGNGVRLVVVTVHGIREVYVKGRLS